MSDVPRILSAIEQGDQTAGEQILPLVYDELRNLAAPKMALGKPGQTLQATALVHEAYLRLVDVEKAQHWKSRGHFFAAAAEAMRRILVDKARRQPGQPPYTLLDFFPEDYLLFVDESHVTVPQVRGMFAGDDSRKTTLVEHGFRLPMAFDNRPLRFEERDSCRGQTVFVSAMSSDWELEQSEFAWRIVDVKDDLQ